MSLIRTFGLNLGSTLVVQDGLISRYLVTTAKTLFPNKLTFTGSGDSRVHISFGGPPFNPPLGRTAHNRKEWATSLGQENAEESE